MFTGIISHIGKIQFKSKNGLEIGGPKDLLDKLQAGASISVDGICLTVAGLMEGFFKVDFMEETVKKTNIQYLKYGDLVNLELPVTPATFFSGHIVQGHVDGVSKLESITQDKNSQILKFSILKGLSKYIVQKGSIAINGVSLTVIEAGEDFFTVGIIPLTLENTVLGKIKRGGFVNVEVDLFAKYTERLLKR